MNTQNYQELVNLYHNLNVYCAIAALIFLVAAIILFIKLKIPKVFGEWTGRTAQKAISEMSAKGASSGSLNSMRIGNDGRRQRRGRTETEVLDSYEYPSTGILPDNTAIYPAPESETTVLSQMSQNTDYLFVIERSIVEIHTDEVM